jgi:hypothetical protein
VNRGSQDQFKRRRREFSAKPVDELLELLSSDDLQTRFIAEMALRDATGT